MSPPSFGKMNKPFITRRSTRLIWKIFQRLSEIQKVWKLVHEIKDRLEDMARNNGAIHFQIGKDYPYLKTRTESTRKLLTMLKKELDPKNLINPGNLGFKEN